MDTNIQNEVIEISTNEKTPAENSKWYVLRIVSGKERKVLETLQKESIRNNWKDAVKQFFLPLEKVYKMQGGKKIIKEKNYFPGYIMVEVVNDDLFKKEIIHQITDINNVMHFLTDGKGSKGTIISLRKNEVNKMLGRVDELDMEEIKVIEPFIIGESVKIIEGPFKNFIATIEEVKDDKKKLVLSVKIFERSTPMEFSFQQVEKIS